MVKCGTSGRPFGIRIEKRGDDWVSTWAFPIDEAKAKREGFDKTKILGSLMPVDKFPGCPYCNAHAFMQCPCGKMICYKMTGSKAEKKSVSNMKCPWCNAEIEEIQTVESFEVKSGNY
jgi:hypothetical protein